MPKKTSPTGNRLKDRKRLKKQSPSILTPVLLIIFFVVAAVGVALYLKLSSTEGVRNQTSSINNSSTIASVLSTNGWTKGNGAAKAVLVEFGDFQCGACAAARLRISKIIEQYGSQLKVVFKQYPMQRIHRNAMIAAQAAEAAGQQFKFWEMHDLLFERQNRWAQVPDAHTIFLKYASELGLDLARFKRDIWDSKTKEKIYRDVMEGQIAQVQSVPAFFLNGKPLRNARDDAEFENLILEGIQSIQ
jgi:protein-disulfide isomerase